MKSLNYDNPQYFINRELSWLEFNDRVLNEGRNKNNPLFERLKFLAIVSSNLDEFFMIRVASLKDMVNAKFSKPDPSGLSPKQQLKRISIRTHKMVEKEYSTYNRSILPNLSKNNLFIVKPNDLNETQEKFLNKFFIENIYPVLTPMAVDSSRPFPLILNKSLNIGVHVKEGDKHIFATVQVPSVLPRLISIPDKGNKVVYILLENVIMMYLNSIFRGKEIIRAYPYRITRNADLSIEEEEAEDLLIEIEKSIKMRKRGAAIRLEVASNMNNSMVQYLKEVLEIHDKDVYYIKGPIDLTFLMKLAGMEGYDELKYASYTPQIPRDLIGYEDIFKAISEKDIFLHHPFESFQPVVDFIKKSAKDSKVLAIKQTLYRVSGDSPIIKALAEAAERGKQVTVLVEVKARFDEENNIIWAKRLEEAGCHVIYGLVGLKTHSKITLVVRKEESGIKRYVHLGTGNYNDITARFYTDMGIFTCNEYMGADASAVFNMLTGYSEPHEWYKIETAPLGLRKKFIKLIENEIKHAKEGKKAKIIGKMNSLVDKGIIKALYRASNAGVKVRLIVRGICCLRGGVEGISENITVQSIVGRYLEHSRIYYFYNNGNEQIYLSSADWMPRNLDRRVELLFPIENNKIKNRIVGILNIIMLDNEKSRFMDWEGKYFKIDKRGKNIVNSQEYFSKLACEGIKNMINREETFNFEPILSSNYDE
ncbi:MAG: RNA degradosome polyphosphate kinase [Anaeromicrobium sp.]|jgi:polyphosphate kinase|uniref:RNA degradosome polyphosphate kinase n=1 Tax=Anaeromicrobium sp. TaxID=1929132 RepID=UPI0025D95502|nr:RNA degradosome polyphosphate kinase [Anaeromicrobium sp.]MCT4593451.1 RNA degradosome polyphosphate kinase [Anaeromicrobium sp.]